MQHHAPLGNVGLDTDSQKGKARNHENNIPDIHEHNNQNRLVDKGQDMSFENMNLGEPHGLGRNDIGFLLGTLNQIGRHPCIVDPLYELRDRKSVV